MTSIEKKVLTIIEESPEGTTHTQLVKSFLQRGYEISGDVSKLIHNATRNLVADGVLAKDQESRIIQMV